MWLVYVLYARVCARESAIREGGLELGMPFKGSGGRSEGLLGG